MQEKTRSKGYSPHIQRLIRDSVRLKENITLLQAFIYGDSEDWLSLDAYDQDLLKQQHFIMLSLHKILSIRVLRVA